MNITIIGSTGLTGRHVLAEALRRGHHITAFTRRPQRLPDTSRLASVVTGDGRDPRAVREAIVSADTVVAIVSSRSRKGPHHAAAVSQILTEAMTDLGVRRLVVTSVYPIVGTKPRLPMALLRLVFADAYADVAEMERIVSGSDLDWTIVRLNRLTNKPARGQPRMTAELFDKPSALTRADVGSAVLDIVEDANNIKTAINVAGPL